MQLHVFLLREYFGVGLQPLAVIGNHPSRYVLLDFSQRLVRHQHFGGRFALTRFQRAPLVEGLGNGEVGCALVAPRLIR